jgi:hypothetical protein
VSVSRLTLTQSMPVNPLHRRLAPDRVFNYLLWAGEEDGRMVAELGHGVISCRLLSLWEKIVEEASDNLRLSFRCQYVNIYQHDSPEVLTTQAPAVEGENPACHCGKSPEEAPPHPRPLSPSPFCLCRAQAPAGEGERGADTATLRENGGRRQSACRPRDRRFAWR